MTDYIIKQKCPDCEGSGYNTDDPMWYYNRIDKCSNPSCKEGYKYYKVEMKGECEHRKNIRFGDRNTKYISCIECNNTGTITRFMTKEEASIIALDSETTYEQANRVIKQAIKYGQHINSFKITGLKVVK